MDVHKIIIDSEQAKAFARVGREKIQAALKDPELKPFLGRFRSPKGYEDWDDHIAMSWIISLGVRMNPDLLVNVDKSGATAMSCLIANVALLEDAPPRYLGRKLAEAFLHTDVPALKTPPEMALPAFRLFIPKGLLTNEHGIGIHAIVVIDRKRIAQLFEEHTGRTQKSGPGLCCLMHCLSGESYYCDFLWSEPDKVLKIDNDTPKDVRTVMGRATSLAAQSVMTMATMPELIVIDDPKVVTAGRGFARGSSELQPAPPTWIGREFRTHVVQPVIRKGQSPPSSSGGLQVRPHWRQGHWRAVACGPKWKDHKLTWIQPCFVGKHALTNT